MPEQDSFPANPSRLSRLFACAVRNLPQLCMRWLTSTPEPWNFAWGYWYAFTLGILSTVFWMQRRVQGVVVLGQLQVHDICMLFHFCIATKAVSIGVLVPSLLPIGALFFAMKYCNLVNICSKLSYMGGNYLPALRCLQ